MLAIEIHIHAAKAFEPPAVIRPSDHARGMVLPLSSRSGPFNPEAHQIEIIDAIADDSVDMIVVKAAAQVGKTTVLLALIRYFIEQKPGPMMIVFPTEEAGRAFVRDALDPMINATPSLRRLIGAGSRGGDSLAAKRFPGGFLTVASASNPIHLASTPIKYLFFDEVSKYPKSARNEGPPVELAERRTHTFDGKGRKIVMVSTPLERGASLIDSYFDRGDQRLFFISCPECGSLDPITFDRVKWTRRNPASARLECLHCGHRMDDNARREAIQHGQFVATADRTRSGTISFHLGVLASANVTLARFIEEFELASAADNLRTFDNLWLGEAHDGGADTRIDAAMLMAKSEPIQCPYPARIEYIVAGADVQKDRIEVSIVGCRDKGAEAWVIVHSVLEGDTSGNGPFKHLDEVLGLTFRTIDGRVLDIAACAIDAGYEPDNVHRFVEEQRTKGRSVCATKGYGGFDRTLFERSPSKKRRWLWNVGVDVAKARVFRRLAMTDPDGIGFIHINNDLPDAYFEGLASERLITTYTGGKERAAFHKKRPGIRNEPLDTLVLATVIASAVKIETKQKTTAQRVDTEKQRLAAIAEMARRLNPGKAR